MKAALALLFVTLTFTGATHAQEGSDIIVDQVASLQGDEPLLLTSGGCSQAQLDALSCRPPARAVCMGRGAVSCH